MPHYPAETDDKHEYNTRYRLRRRKIGIKPRAASSDTGAVRRGPSRKAKKRRLYYVEEDSDSDSDYAPISGNDSTGSSSSAEEDTDDRPAGAGVHQLLHSALFRLGSSSAHHLAAERGEAERGEAEAEAEAAEAQYLRTLSRRELREYRRKEEELEDQRAHQIPLRCQVVQMPIQASAKLLILERIQLLQQIEEGTSEYPKLKQWVDAVLKIPFGKYEDVPVSIQDGQARIRAYLRGIRQALDSTVYGHNVAKNDIMQLVSQWISNPESMSQVIGIAGPPGTGKTTLVRHGIAKALGRPFVQISLGGATDACTLNGHSYTYEGATWGRISAYLMQTKCMNPVIFFDEVDKVSESQTGQEIIGLLIHLTDTTQNDEFIDRYFDGVPLDLSRALMIFSFNDVDALSPILRDRMTVVTTAPFQREDKIRICARHMLPAVLKTVGFHKSDITMSDETIQHLIQRFSQKEEGVRGLKRALTKLTQRLNVLRLTGGSLCEKNKKEKDEKKDLSYIPYRIKDLKFPLRLSAPMVDTLLPASEDEDHGAGAPPPSMYT